MIFALQLFSPGFLSPLFHSLKSRFQIKIAVFRTEASVLGLGASAASGRVVGWRVSGRSFEGLPSRRRSSLGPERRAQGGGHKARFVAEGGEGCARLGAGPAGGGRGAADSQRRLVRLRPPSASGRRRLSSLWSSLQPRRGLRADPAPCPFVGAHWALSARPPQALPAWRRPLVPE